MKKLILSAFFALAGMVMHAQTIMSENFSGATPPAMPTNWSMVNTGVGGNGWETTTGTTNFYFGTVPNTGVHSTYARVNEYAVHKNVTAMTSGVFSLSGVASPYMSYDYIFFKARLNASPYTWEAAWVEFTDDGTTWNFLDSVPALSTATWTTRYVALPATSSATCQLRFHYSDNGANLVGVAIDEVTVFNAQANNLALVSVTPKAGNPQGDFVVTGNNATFGGVVRNLGPTPITTFSTAYQVGAGTPVIGTVTGVNIAAMATYTFTCSTPYTVTTLGAQPVAIGVNAAGDPDNSNDTMSTQINGISMMPDKRLMCEEGTGIWCGFCVRGIIFMDSLWGLHSDKVSIVAVHDRLNGTDPLAGENATTLAYDSFVTSKISGYPSVLYDRRYSSDPSNAFVYYNNANNNYFGFADMSIGVIKTSTTITASVTVTPRTDLNGDYRLAMVITEDDVHNTLSTYGQHNYYGVGGPYNSTPMRGAGYSFNDSAQVIPAASCYYQFVDRYTVPNFRTSPNGVASSLPATMTSGTSYTYTFNPVTIGASWVPSRLRVVVMMLDNNPNNFTYGQVLNSINGVYSSLNMENVTSGIRDMRVFPNPANADAHIAFELNNESMVHFAIYDYIGRNIYTSHTEKMSAGGQQLNFSTANLAPGIYNVVVSTEAGSETMKLSVIK